MPVGSGVLPPALQRIHACIGLMDDRPYLVWNFNSLLQGIQLMFSMMLTDESRPIRMCKNCGKAFIARRYRDKFCSKECSEGWKEKSDS